MNADGSDRRLLTVALDRQCGPYPLAQAPIWDGDRLLFGVEDRGNIHLYTVPADGSAAPELHVGGERQIGLYDLRGGSLVFTATTHTEPMELYAGIDGSRLTDVGKGFSEARELVEAERFVAVSPDGSEVDVCARPAGRLFGRRALPGAPLDPRRPVRAVRHGLLRRVPGLRRRRLRGVVREPAGRLRSQRGVGASDPRPDRLAAAPAGARSTSTT